MPIGNPAWLLRHAIEIAVVVVGLWFFKHGRRKLVTHPVTMLLDFCSESSIALSGAVAGLTLGAVLFVLGMLGSPRFWALWGAPRGALILLAGCLGAGALTGILRKRIRRRWPEPIELISFAAMRVGRTTGLTKPVIGNELWMDEILIPIFGTPLAWKALASVQPVWTVFFMFMAFVLPTYVLYSSWEWLHTGWLRWLGDIDTRRERQFAAYEVVLHDDELQPWIGNLQIDYDEDAAQYRAVGELPDRFVFDSLQHRLADIENKPADLSGVHVQSDVPPNPRYRAAKAVRQRNSMGRYWPFK